jgi:hypothetical protein
MPRHLAIDANVISGTVHMTGTKTVQVDFRDSQGNPVAFTKAPRLQITLLNNLTQVPYRVANVKTGNVYTGVIVGFSSIVTLDFEWEISERE